VILEAILPYLFEDFDPSFRLNAGQGDIIIAGDNFGCGSSREHPAVGLAHLGIKAVIVKSVNRIFYRSCINQGLPLIVDRMAAEAYRPGDTVDVDFERGTIAVGSKVFDFTPLPPKLKKILDMKGLVNYLNSN
jgi:3-isopropylmalate/(R)-2-methylmalate dehydratase large subunit